MKKLECIPTILCMVIVIACFHVSVLGQTSEERKLATVSSSGSSLRWQVAVSYTGGTLTVVAPDGRVFRNEFRAGAAPDFSLTNKQGGALPDGQYTYELRLTTASPDAKKARAKDDEPEADRAARKPLSSGQALVEAGSFAIVNGAVILPGAIEEQGAKAQVERQRSVYNVVRGGPALRHHIRTLFATPDQVIPDDLIVQGSACVGFDCVNNESFSFDTIRMKENNTRLTFMDTSTAGGFPTNDWTIRANSGNSGGESFLGFVDKGATSNGDDVGTIVFQVDAGAPANSLRVSSTGRIGLRTATPVLDVHANTSNTPAIRLEQNSSGGFTAQTWDIAGNEANFFVRDVTGGSRLPFRIRPGAPTSSIDISAAGDVGIGTASPGARLHAVTAENNSFAGHFEQNNVTASNGVLITTETAAQADAALHVRSNNGSTIILSARNNGRVGIGTTAPDQLLSVNGDASKVGGGSWQSFSDARLKWINGNFSRGLSAVLRLQPLKFKYKPDNALGLRSEGQHVGFSAQDVEKVIPEAVNRNEDGYLMVNNDPILWTMLNAIKEQQKEIAELKAEVRRLQRKTQTRRR